MKIKLTYLLALVIVFSSCGGNQEQAAIKEKKRQIQTVEKDLYSAQEKSPVPAKADPLISLYLDFARTYPKDEESDEFYFKAAELTNALGRHKDAISLFETVHVNYPNSEKAPYALFLQGFIYENNLRDFSKAKELYTKVIEQFPKHELAKQSEVLIQNLGKSDEELIREFESKSSQ